MKRRGFLLVTSLLFVIMLLLLGMGFLGSQAARYKGARRAAQSAQAKGLALGGLEECRVKLERDVNFPPPPSGPNQFLFTYSERLDFPDGTPGSYTVIIDRTYEQPPYQVWTVTSIGSVGPPDTPIAQYTLKAELDVAEQVRGAATPNPNLFHYTHIEDQSSL